MVAFARTVHAVSVCTAGQYEQLELVLMNLEQLPFLNEGTLDDLGRRLQTVQRSARGSQARTL